VKRLIQDKKFLLFSAIIIFIFILFYGFPTIFYPFGRDQGIYACAGDLILQGKQPYKDCFDFKPPLIFYTYALSFTLFGKSMWVIRLLDLLGQISTSILIFIISYRFLVN
jgi:hypothetical protein